MKKHSVKKRNARQERISQCLVKICRLIVIALLAVIGIRAWALYSQRSGSTNEVIPSSPVSLFRPTIVNRAPAPNQFRLGWCGSLAANFRWEQTILRIWTKSE